MDIKINTQESDLEALVNNIDQGILVHVNFTPLFMNDYLLNFIGVPLDTENISDLNIFNYVHEDDRPLITENFSKRINDNSPLESYEIWLRHKDGELKRVIINMRNIKWQGEKAILVLITDTSAMYNLKMEKERLDLLFHDLFEFSPNALSISRTNDGKFLKINNAFTEIFGYSSDELVGNTALDLNLWVDIKDRQELVSMLTSENRSFTMVIKARHKNGHYFHCRITAVSTNIQDENYIMMTGENIDEQINYEKELMKQKELAEQANHSKSDFLASMSHELRTPLNAILGFSEVIQNQILGPIGIPKYLEYVNDIHYSGVNLLEIINDILDLSKVESGRLNVNFKETYIADLFNEVSRLIVTEAEKKNINIQVDIEESDMQIRLDEKLTRQCLFNLLSNSIKFSDEGSIMLSAGISEGGATLSVKDVGIGMTKTEIDTALSAFGQVESVLTRNQSGTGLGLPLVSAFMSAQGGTLTIESEPSTGTTVNLWFPNQ